MDIITTTNFRKDISNILDRVTTENKTVEITIKSKQGFNDGVVMIPKKEYQRMQEELYLGRTGTLRYVLNAMENSTDVDFEEV
ncbi:type II toxin-antitoxin system Phd/YefM family antitoxin [Carnobacterium sp. 17-4]|uniref:type II toxin-antitoxin system Phd/YefM family antitoxin n=1 Tax=Carnobacterium sp. (strain 17-4) TaxID=208596 RepID=UPI0002F75025|nr:type II toxin-antitoxin system Phd/YefM family antitoxin [Carnobacterium sp. 17-4]